MSLLPHNQIVYDKLTDAFNISNSVLLVHGTGLGKSFIFAELTKTVFQGKKILFVVPKHAVKDGINSYDDYKSADIDIDFKTYNYFSDEIKSERALDSYDIFVFDEAHHLGSELFGKNAREIFKSDKLILGMTATNMREDKVNVADFFKETVIGMSTFDAIRDGLIPPFEYLVCGDDAEERTGFDKNVKDYRKVVSYTESLPLLSETIAKNPRDKWLCFFPSIKKLEEYESIIREMFSDEYELIKITTKHDSNVEDIAKCKKAVVLCIDKLLEGVHVPKVQGIILFRNIGSLPVFQQCLGRVVHVGDSESPIVLDCTKTAIKMLAKLLKSDKRHGGAVSVGTSSKPILYCSLCNIEHFNLTKLLALASDGLHDLWTDEELCILKDRYGKVNNRELQKELPKHSISSIQAKAAKLGIKSVLAGAFWTEEEDEILKKLIDEGLSFRLVSERMPGRDYNSIKNRAKRLGLKRDVSWKQEELDYVKKYYGKKPIEEIAAHLGRTYASVKNTAKKLKLKAVERTNWTEAMIVYLKANYGKLDRNAIGRELGIDPKAVTGKAAMLGLQKRRAV